MCDSHAGVEPGSGPGSSRTNPRMTVPDVTARERSATFDATHPHAKVAGDDMPRDILPLQRFPTSPPQTHHLVLSLTAKPVDPVEVVAYSWGASAHCNVAW